MNQSKTKQARKKGSNRPLKFPLQIGPRPTTQMTEDSIQICGKMNSNIQFMTMKLLSKVKKRIKHAVYWVEHYYVFTSSFFFLFLLPRKKSICDNLSRWFIVWRIQWFFFPNPQFDPNSNKRFSYFSYIKKKWKIKISKYCRAIICPRKPISSAECATL